MSWPSDGGPRFKVASIRGGNVGRAPGLRGWDSFGTVEFYVLDRATCHRVVRRVVVPSDDRHARTGLDAIEHFAARLNGESDPL